MDVKALCLGVLSMGPASGYEIRKFFGQSFSHFYTAGYGSIYPALEWLSGRGLVSRTEMEQAKRPDKKVYNITEKGKAFFRKELEKTYPAHKVRSQFLVLTFFAEMLSPQKLEEMLDRREKDTHEVIGLLEKYEEQAGDCCPGVKFTIGYGKHVLKASLDYIRMNRRFLKGSLSKSGVGKAKSAASRGGAAAKAGARRKGKG